MTVTAASSALGESCMWWEEGQDIAAPEAPPKTLPLGNRPFANQVGLKAGKHTEEKIVSTVVEK